LIEQYRVEASATALLQSLALARSTAVLKGKIVCVTNNDGSWRSGWTIFIDTNHNCVRDNTEIALATQGALAQGIETFATVNAKNHFMYGPSGLSEQLNGAWQADSVYVCSENKSITGHRVVVSRGGRARSEAIPSNSSKCQANL
jgi:type IV fimbrial biogenesis protein FimT